MILQLVKALKNIFHKGLYTLDMVRYLIWRGF